MSANQDFGNISFFNYQREDKILEILIGFRQDVMREIVILKKLVKDTLEKCVLVPTQPPPIYAGTMNFQPSANDMKQKAEKKKKKIVPSKKAINVFPLSDDFSGSTVYNNEHGEFMLHKNSFEIASEEMPQDNSPSLLSSNSSSTVKGPFPFSKENEDMKVEVIENACNYEFNCTASTEENPNDFVEDAINNTQLVTFHCNTSVGESVDQLVSLTGSSASMVSEFCNVQNQTTSTNASNLTKKIYYRNSAHDAVTVSSSQYSISEKLKTFKAASKGTLGMNLGSSTLMKSFDCNMCGKSFKKQCNLNDHIMVHTGVKPYQCTVCAKSFIKRVQLKCHFRTHTGEKPYQCQFCEKKFSYWSNFSVHKRIHTGEKPYECEHCKKCFTQINSLKKHVQSLHQIQL